MNCEKCGNKSPVDASYCTQCGSPLGWLCECSFINRSGHKFCGGCGIPIKNKITINNNSPKNFQTYIHQFSSKQISNLVQESLYFKSDKEEKLDQSDIDNIFSQS